MKDIKLRKLILSLLETEYAKTTAMVVAELRAEYPEAWLELQKEGEMLYGSGCSSLQQPTARISQLLQAMPSDRVKRSRRGSETCWRRKA